MRIQRLNSLLQTQHLNDMLVNHDGRAWVGNFGFDLMGGGQARSTVLIGIEPDGTAKVAADGLGAPNGMVLTPDSRTLIVAESMMSWRRSSPGVAGVWGAKLRSRRRR
jgi:sugar lactone lactonase YvrE